MPCYPMNSRRAAIKSLSTIVVFIFFCSAARQCACAQVTATQFLKEAPQAWDAYLDWAADLQGEFNYVMQNVQTGKILSSHRTQFKQAEACGMVSIAVYRDGEPGGSGIFEYEDASAQNPRYAFQVHRKSSDGAWALVGGTTSLERQNPDGNPRFLTAVEKSRRGANLVLRLQEPGGIDIPEAVRSGTMEILDVSSTGVSGIYRIGFRCPWSDGDRKRIAEGTMDCDRAHSWMILDYEYQVSMERLPSDPAGLPPIVVESKAKGHLDYDFESEFAIPKRIEIVKSYPSLPQFGVVAYETKSVINCKFVHAPASADEFTLEAFGLVTPKDLRAPTRLWLWFAGGGIVALIVALLLLKGVWQKRAAAA